VWIETIRFDGEEITINVTPHAGVWIETINENNVAIVKIGHASCRRVD